MNHSDRLDAPAGAAGSSRTDEAVDDATASAAGVGSGTAPPEVARPRRLRPLLWAPFVLLVVLGLLAAGAGLRGLVQRDPGDGSVDAGFARDMSEHHAQAVQMAMVELRHGQDPQIRAMAQDIALTQEREIGVMSSWLSGWGLSQVRPGQPMQWMRAGAPGDTGDGGSHSDHAGGSTDGMSMDMSTPAGTGAGTAPMPGMATGAELARLASSSGHDLDVLFLTLMIRHHRGGVAMAQYASRHAGQDQVRTLARAMVVAQSAEIDQMQADLQRLGAPRA
jgi:uncharacterized protein (DUF305 family)